MDLFQIIILAVVEGITEFLPVSSTGHLILTAEFLHIPSSEFLKTFEIVIQSGAVLAVLSLYWRKLMADKSLIVKAGIGLIPTLIIGALAYSFVKSILLESHLLVASTLIIGGIIIIVLEKWVLKPDKKDADEFSEITYKQAFLTGLTQTLAIIPGVSRSAASIFGGRLMGMEKRTATEFSFILALPTILAASGLDVVVSAPSFSPFQVVQIILGTAFSYVVARFAIKWLLDYITTHGFTIFGWYRIAVGILFLALYFV